VTRADLGSAPGAALAWPARCEVLGVPVSATGYEEASRLVLDAARAGRPALVAHLSAHGLAEAARDPAFRRRLRGFDLVAPDGQPVRWALRLLHGVRLADRVYGPELMARLCAAAARAGLPVYLYGSTPAVLERLEARLRRDLPGLVVAGAESPPFRPPTAEEDAASVTRIRASGARLVFLGLGCPKQERFASSHRDRLDAVQICVGAAFDFLAGTKPMAPRWMQRAGLEWLFRLACEPRRLWRRYLVGNLRFVVGLGLELWRSRLPGPARRAPAKNHF
jgi:exopolysaccharide biosynthesis WecB/TagA/CpsF family protein